MKIISKNLKGLIKEKGISYSELGKRVGVSRWAIRQYVESLSTPQGKVPYKIAKVFGLHPKEIWTIKFKQ